MRTDKLNLKLKAKMGERTKKILVKVLHPFRNNFILFNVSNRVKVNQVNLNYWDEADNLGDTLTPVIVSYMLKKKDIAVDKRIPQSKHLYAVGSILTAGIQDTTVWGSGILNPKLLYRIENRKLDIRAVRGPLTQVVLTDYGYETPLVYGDPAILMPEIYNPEKVEHKCKFGLVTHKDYNLNKSVVDESILDDILQIDIKTRDYKKFIRDLLSVDIVISSSLHGIILAEAYGVPAILLQPQVDAFKYYDYYYSTGRLSFPIAKTVEKALKTTPAALPNNLEQLRSDLKKSFPYDLYY